ncbi:MFS transporter [Azorhizobium doebereinerae]|uniref:MFS transporter n=1 Tax=Azorhizobium doebereinerae TaxID=281091 RepID=UPI0003F9EE5A|nr:MFS transporter [Azorhizobium doebereinerae]
MIGIGLRGGISAAIIVILCAALGMIAWGAQRAAVRTIVPTIVAKAESVGRSAAALVETAVEAGIPMEKLAGVPAYFEDLRSQNSELSEIRLTQGGTVLFQSGEREQPDWPQVRVPVAVEDGPSLGDIVIFIDPSIISEQVAAVLVDVAFIGVVALLIALELVALVVGARGVSVLAGVEARVRDLARGRLVRHEGADGDRLIAPIDRQLNALASRHAFARDEAERRGDARALATLDAVAAKTGLGSVHSVGNQAAAVVRPALFLFMLAEELTRPFLPRYVQSIAPASLPISPDVAISLPIVAFMAAVALCQLPFAALSERIGRRGGFMLGAGLAACGYVLSGLTGSYFVFLGARVLSAVGYALVFVSAQGHVVDRSAPSERAEGLAVFVRAIMVAALCGPPIGGVIGDRLGGNIAFLFSGGLAALALVLAGLSLPASQRRGGAHGLGLTDLKAAIQAPRLAALLFGCAFPAKFILAALCFYLIPVELQREGFSSAAVGRLQMIYPVIMVLGVPLFAALADRWSARAGFVAAGGTLAGAGALLVAFGTSPVILALVLALLGIGQAMSIAPQSALVADSARHVPGGHSAGVLGLFRLVERSGNAVGPAAAGFLLGSVGFVTSMMTVGGLVVFGAAAFILSGRVPARRDRGSPAAPEEASVP